jgi:pre-mRNA-splicing factor SPF27
VPDDPFHALLPPLPEPNFSAAIQGEMERVAAKQPLKAIDLSRYESLEAPETASLPPPQAREAWLGALSKSYASSTYLSGRRAHLALLDSYGKNAWLVGNWQLEAELMSLEKELAEVKRDIDGLAVRRRRMQEEAGGEIKTLEETWKTGVGRVLETEIAAERLRQRVLEERRRVG